MELCSLCCRSREVPETLSPDYIPCSSCCLLSLIWIYYSTNFVGNWSCREEASRALYLPNTLWLKKNVMIFFSWWWWQPLACSYPPCYQLPLILNAGTMYIHFIFVHRFTLPHPPSFGNDWWLLRRPQPCVGSFQIRLECLEDKPPFGAMLFWCVSKCSHIDTNK